MNTEIHEQKLHNSNAPSVFAGLLIGGLAGAVTMLLYAPQSGKETRLMIHDKSIEIRNQATEMVEDAMEQVRMSGNKLATGSRDKVRAVIQQGQGVAFGGLVQVEEAAQAGQEAIQNAQA